MHKYILKISLRNINVFLAMLFLFSQNVSLAQSENGAIVNQESSARIGFVDPRIIMESAPQAELALSKMEKDFDSRRQEIISMREEIKLLEDSLLEETEVGDDEKELEQSATMIKIRELKRDFARKQDELKEDISLRRNDELAKLQSIVRQSILDLAEQQNFDLIVEQAVYVSDQIDITNMIISDLKQKFKLQHDETSK